MEKENNILVITTEGCEACSIAINNIKNAITQSGLKINLEVKDWHEFSRKFITSNKVKDFPTVMFNKYSIIKYKATGSYPQAVYLRWIDLHLK